MEVCSVSLGKYCRDENLIRITATVTADITAHYGAEYISGVTVLAGVPYLSMHSLVVHPVFLELAPNLLSPDVEIFAQTCREFSRSCFSGSFPVSDSTLWSWTVAIAIQVCYHRVQDRSSIRSSQLIS
jgi:hypothetical protein